MVLCYTPASVLNSLNCFQKKKHEKNIPVGFGRGTA